jgi:hypothetical protein
MKPFKKWLVNSDLFRRLSSALLAVLGPTGESAWAVDIYIISIQYEDTAKMRWGVRRRSCAELLATFKNISR